MEMTPPGTQKVAVTEDMPSELEYRFILPLFAYWRSIGTDDLIPSFAGVDLSELQDLHSQCFAVELVGGGSAPIFVAMGSQLATHLHKSLIGCPISDAPVDSLPGIALSYIDEMLEKGVPISRGGEFVQSDGTKMLYRSVLLPMSDDGENIDAVLGGANCRVIVDEATTHHLPEEA